MAWCEAETTRESGQNLTQVSPIKTTRDGLWFLPAKAGGVSGAGFKFAGSREEATVI